MSTYLPKLAVDRKTPKFILGIKLDITKYRFFQNSSGKHLLTSKDIVAKKYVESN